VNTSRRSLLSGGLALSAATPALLRGTSPADRPAAARPSPVTRASEFLGRAKHELPTPALVLDLETFEANVDRMARHAKAAGIALRPHAKTHKCVEVARRQVAAGALGVCVATIREAEAMADGGIGGLLITSELVGADKIRRLVRLSARQPDTMSVVDHPGHAEQLDEAAAAAKLRLNVLIDIDPGSRRTGVPAGAPAKELARHVARLRHLALRGIHCYSGASAHVVGFAARQAHSEKAMLPAIATCRELRQEGLPLEILTGGSTGTYNIDPAFKGMTELQVGSYVFMDVDYRKIGGQRGALYDDFGAALRVIATVISKREARRATVDAGIKAFATDRKFGPELTEPAGASYSWGGDEHGILDLQQAGRDVQLGERLEFIVPHCDPNVNLYDRLFCLRGDRVEAIWPVARGYG